jgi:bromodomain-containing factor 1
MTPEQQRYCVAIVKQLKKHRDAWPFLNPVDPVALNIPDYPTIIKRPMDLSQVERRLTAKEYQHVNDFISDVRLIFDNCYLYNGRDAPISILAQNLEEVFNNQLRKMPSLVSVIDEKNFLFTNAWYLPRRIIMVLVDQGCQKKIVCLPHRRYVAP